MRSFPVLGCGVGLRSGHYPVITETWPRMDWFEAISENYMDTGGRPLHILEKVRHHYPLALHGTSLSIGSTDPLSHDYLVRLKNLIQRVDPFIVSDHLCWSSVGGDALHDLLPLPFTEEAIQHVARRVEEVQEFIGRRILLENVSTYVTYQCSVIPEWEFLTEVARRSGCGILLDLNNIYVNSFNHQFDPLHYIRSIPGELVGQFHLAGHTDRGKFLFDTHSDHVIEQVWKLYEEALRLWGPISTLIEWDEAIPSFEILSEEAGKARKIYSRAVGQPIKRAQTPPGVGEPGNAVSLLESQLWMKSRIKPREKNPLNLSSKESLLNPQGGEPGEVRLAVYAEGYLARIQETLNEVYESVHQVTGSEEFEKLSETYARRYPSHHYNLNFAGRHFPEFLQTPETTGSFPFLGDLAKLEWLIWEAFHAFDDTPVSTSEIPNLPLEEWENARLEFQPSIRLMDSPWPILDIWRARKQAPEEAQKIDIRNRPQHILVSRKEDQVRCELLDQNAYRLLEGLLLGRTLSRVCEEMAEGLREDELFPVSEWFSRWVHEGLIHRIKLDQNFSRLST